MKDFLEPSDRGWETLSEDDFRAPLSSIWELYREKIEDQEKIQSGVSSLKKRLELSFIHIL